LARVIREARKFVLLKEVGNKPLICNEIWKSSVCGKDVIRTVVVPAVGEESERPWRDSVRMFIMMDE